MKRIALLLGPYLLACAGAAASASATAPGQGFHAAPSGMVKIVLKGPASERLVSANPCSQETDILSDKGKISVKYEIADINIKGLKIQTPYEQTALTGNSGMASVTCGNDAYYSIHLIDKNEHIKAMSYYFRDTKVLRFSPTETARSLVYASPWSNFRDYNNILKFCKELSKDKYRGRLELIVKSLKREGIIFTDKAAKLANDLALEITQKI